MLDWGNRTDITIVITAATVAVVISGTIITGEAIIAIDSVVRVSDVIFIGRPGAQEPSYRRVFLGRVIDVLFF
jgi:hypothetical protein